MTYQQKSTAPDQGKQCFSNQPALDSTAPGAYPARLNTVTAEVLCRLLEGERLTGMEAVFSASTTRLAAVVHRLKKDYGWSFETFDLNVGTKDGRIAFIRVYYFNRVTIRRAFDAGALVFCRSVTPARAKTRRHAPQAARQAHRLNAIRDPNQQTMFGGSL
jgi:hypothetical protein